METRALSESLILAISDPASWSGALKEVCAFTGTSKALVSLRDQKTAKIVFPEDVSVEFASPLIFGFEEAYVASFVDQYAELDPWTGVERENHPYFPYAMSRYLPLEKLRNSAFWEWLEPQGINECVVCELGQGGPYWAALNLYFDLECGDKSAKVVERVKEILPLLRSTWASGREFQIAKSAECSLDMVMSALDAPAALITPDAKTVAYNSAMCEIVAEWGGRIDAGRTLRLPENIPLGIPEGVPEIRMARSGWSDTRRQASITSFHRVELAGGETRQLFLLTVSSAKRQMSERGELIWDAQILTERERTLVRLVAQGRKFREAQSEMGVSYPRIMQLWKSARGKLELDDVTDLRLSYRLSQI